MDVGWDYTRDEQEAVDERVGVRAGEEEDGEGGEKEIDEGEAEAGEHVGRCAGRDWALHGYWAMGHLGGSQWEITVRVDTMEALWRSLKALRPRLPGLRTLAARKMFMPRPECLAELGQNQNGPRQSCAMLLLLCCLHHFLEA